MNYELKLEEDSLDAEFLNDFLAEVLENVEDIEMNILTFEKESDNPEVINALFRSFHTIKGLAGFVGQTLIEKLAHETETILDKCGKNTITVTKDVIDLILNSSGLIKLIAKDVYILNNPEFIAEAKAFILKLENECGSTEGPQLGEILVEEKNIREDAYIRVSSNKINSLIDKMGKLTQQTDLDNKLTEIIKELQDIVRDIRLTSLKSMFKKIRKIASHTINALGKDIELITTGDEIEVDRLVAERLFAPLVHLVKNAIYHGIENKGTVQIHAYNKLDNIYIKVIDDGKGLDINKIYQKAMEKGLIDLNKEYSEKELQEFIMLPGFSTAETINNIAGRGVGLDVVRTEIQKYGGKIEIISEKGKGTMFILLLNKAH